LGEIALEIRNNFNPKKEREQIYLWLEHIEQQTLRISSYWSSNETLSLKLKFNSWDILFWKMRPYFRKVVKPNFSWVCSWEILVLNSNNWNSQNFLFYVVANEKFIDDVNKTTWWADRPRAKWEVMKNLEIFLPPFPTQQKIASILSKYDDLIENNNKRIKILEETAQSIYEEWFVKYNFPWSENIKMIDSGNDDFGMIPEGWGVKKVEEISLIVSKWPSLNYVDDKSQWIPVINQKCIRNWEIELNTIQFAEKLKDDKSYCYLEKYDILINSMWTWTLWRVSRNLTIDEKYIIHNCISFVRSNQNKLKQTVLYYQIKSKENHFISLSTWSTWQTTLNIKEIKNVDLIIPDIKIQNNFDNIVIKMFDEIWALKKQNQNLKETRDLLIPRLVSGELDVENLDVK